MGCGSGSGPPCARCLDNVSDPRGGADGADPGWPHIGPAVGFLLLSILALAPLWPADQVFGFRDQLVYFQPMRLFAHQSFQEGRFPVRNPYIACGNPFFANPETQLLYPPAWGYLLWGLRGGGLLYYLSHLWIGAMGAHLLARRMGAAGGASAAAGVVFGFSGFAFSSFEVQNVMSDRLLPWVLWAAVGLRSGPTWGRVFGFGALSAVMFHGGEPSIWAAGQLTALLVVAGFGGSVMASVAGGAASAVLSAGQLIPTFAYVLETDRLHGFGAEVGVKWSLGGWEMLELLVPELLAAPGFGKHAGGQLYLASVCLGVLPFLLVFAGALARRWGRLEKVLAASGLLYLLVALGGNVPLFRAYWWMTFGAVRYPIRFVTFVSLAVAILAALGLSRLGATPLPARSWLGVALLGLAPLTLAAAKPELRESLATIGPRWVVLLLLGAVVTFLMRGRRRVGLLVLLVAVELVFLPRREFLYTVSAEELSQGCRTAWTQALDDGRFRVMPVVDARGGARPDPASASGGAGGRAQAPPIRPSR